MKKAIIISIIILITSVMSFSQPIAGKWSMTMSERDVTMDFVFEFSTTDKVSLSINSTAGEAEMMQIKNTATITGKYECAGKALCIMFNNDAKSTSNLVFSDFVPQTKRNEVINALKPYMPKMEAELVKRLSAFTSAGLYSQILQLNDSVLVIKHPNQDADTFTRVK